MRLSRLHGEAAQGYGEEGVSDSLQEGCARRPVWGGSRRTADTRWRTNTSESERCASVVASPSTTRGPGAPRPDATWLGERGSEGKNGAQRREHRCGWASSAMFAWAVTARPVGFAEAALAATSALAPAPAAARASEEDVGARPEARSEQR